QREVDLADVGRWVGLAENLLKLALEFVAVGGLLGQEREQRQAHDPRLLPRPPGGPGGPPGPEPGLRAGPGAAGFPPWWHRKPGQPQALQHPGAAAPAHARPRDQQGATVLVDLYLPEVYNK